MDEYRGCPIVNEFKDVFASEILGMPPARAVEFTIELVLELHLYRRHLIKWHHLR